MADGAPLSGQHAVVTGGARGIGAAIADELARLGACVTVMGRNVAALEAARTALEQRFGRDMGAQQLDVTSEDDVNAAFAAAAEALGSPAILVNNAGQSSSTPVLKTDLTTWNQLIAVNLTGTFLCTRAVLGGMVKAGYGRVVNIASVAGLAGQAYIAPYCASKHGVVGFTRALALEMAKKGVTVNAVCPGYVETDMAEQGIANVMRLKQYTREQAWQELARHNPQGRLIKPEEVAQPVGWLCLPSSASITGQSIVVAGGEVTN